MKYWWDSKDLRKDLKELEKMFNKETNPKEKEIMSFYIWHTKNLIIDEELEAFNQESEESYLDYLSRTVPLFEIYYPYITHYKKTVSKFLSNNYELYSEDTRQLSHDAIIELVHEFFKSTNFNIYNKFLEIYKRKHKLIRFLNDDELEGKMIFVPGVNKPYISLTNNTSNYKEALINTTHELVHGITALINPERYVSNDCFYSEIETTFFELIANDYFSNQLNDRGFYDYERKRIEAEYYIADEILEYKNLVDRRFILGNPSEDEFLEMVSNNYQKQLLITNPETNFEIDIKYLFSYIVAIELYELYKKDKNSAFEVLNEIIAKSKYESEYTNITRMVTPGKSLIKFRNRIYRQTNFANKN